MWEDELETLHRGLQELEQICQEWAQAYGAQDAVVVTLRQTIARERARVGTALAIP